MFLTKRLYCVKTHAAETPNRPAYSPYAERLDAVVANMDDRMIVWMDALARAQNVYPNRYTRERFDFIMRAVDHGAWGLRRDIELYQHYRELEKRYWETNRMPRYPDDIKKQIKLLQEKLKETCPEE